MTNKMNLQNLNQNEYSFEEKVNENFFKLESFSTLSINKQIASSAEDVVSDSLYLIIENQDELFKDKNNQIACYNNNLGWFFYVPQCGNIAYLQNEKKFIYFDGNKWEDFNTKTTNINSTTEGQVDISVFLQKTQNLNDLNDKNIARDNLNVYSKNEVDEKITNINNNSYIENNDCYTREEIDSKFENLNNNCYLNVDTYTKSEIDEKIANLNSGGNNIDVGCYLKNNNNLNDLNDKNLARDNLNVYSKNEVDEKMIDSFNSEFNKLDQDYACHKLGTLRDWEIRRVGDYKMSAQKTDHDNWLICDGRAVSRTTYNKLFDLIGTNFGAGDGSTTFNLPDFRDRTVWGANCNLNKTIESGLPNIQGEFDINGSIKNSTGSFKYLTEGVTKKGGSSSIDVGSISFDASASNSIYGKSTIVQPPAVCVNIFIYSKE